MSCVEAVKYFHEFMDKELDKSHYLGIKKHIDHCEVCHRRYEFEKGIRTLVKAYCINTTAPVYLRDRIIEGINSRTVDNTEQASREDVYKKKATIRKLFSSRTYAVAASILILVAGGIFYYTNYYGTDSITTIVDDAVKNHVVAVNDNLVFNEKTSVVGNVNRYLENTINTNLSNSSPVLNAAKISVMGGAPVRFSGTSSPCVLFDKGGNKLSLQIVRNSSIPMRNLERVKLGTKEFYIGNRRGFNSVLWEEEGIMYCLTSDINKSEMLQFAATLTSR